MPQNLEIKCPYPSALKARRIARGLGAESQGILRQTDTYFDVKSGRLKLREINGKRFELIYYHRPNKRSTRYSNYKVIPVRNPQALKHLLGELFGVTTVVRKRRVLYLLKNARIHIDTVGGLGVFVEFEVIVNVGKRQAKKMMSYLMAEFGISNDMLIAGSYSDMKA